MMYAKISFETFDLEDLRQLNETFQMPTYTYFRLKVANRKTWDAVLTPKNMTVFFLPYTSPFASVMVPGDQIVAVQQQTTTCLLFTICKQGINNRN